MEKSQINNKSKITTILVIAALLLIGISFGLTYTNAKYTSQVIGNVSTSVAKYVFDVSASDSYNSDNNVSNLILAQTCDEKTLVNGKIAPGTSGSFDIIINTEDSDVAVGYVVTFTTNSENALPSNLKLTLDGNTWKFEDGISGTISANSASKTATHTITWTWDYETTNGDLADTSDGENAYNYSYVITAIGTQVEPVVVTN